MSEFDTVIDLGFYGKLPTYGDFIQKRLPTSFINPWHEWLQSGMVACRERNPDGWMASYLNCPAWSFALSAGVCGEQPVAGVTIPSVDRVGRYFNFTVASILPDAIAPAVFAHHQKSWFDNLENLALSVLEQERDQDGIEDLINELAAELQWKPSPLASFSRAETSSKIVPVEASGVTQLIPELLHQHIIGNQEHYSLWWHHGSAQVSAQLVSCAGMPSPETYLGLMMDEDLITTPEQSPQAPEVDYLDALLSD